MKIKKKKLLLVIVAILLVLWLFISRQDAFQFRMSEEKIRENLSGIPVQIDSYEAEGTEIGYIELARDSAPVLVMLHGSPGSATAFLSYFRDEELRETFHLIAPDRPGFGFSDFGSKGKSLEAQSIAFGPLLQRFRGRKVLLIGHSLAGPLIGKMALDFPEAVDGLMMVAPSIDPELEPATWWKKPFDWLLLRWILPPSFRVSNQEILPLKKELQQLANQWKDIDIPVVIVQGTRDRLVSAKNADFVEEKLDHLSFLHIDLVENGSHFILWTELDRMKQNLRQLWEMVRASTGDQSPD